MRKRHLVVTVALVLIFVLSLIGAVLGGSSPVLAAEQEALMTTGTDITLVTNPGPVMSTEGTYVPMAIADDLGVAAVDKEIAELAASTSSLAVMLFALTVITATSIAMWRNRTDLQGRLRHTVKTWLCQLKFLMSGSDSHSIDDADADTGRPGKTTAHRVAWRTQRPSTAPA